jgi:hypothetical protein
MRRAIFLLCLLPLAACGQPGTPLSHAINALRAGDHDALLAAAAEAQDALKTAVKTDGDMCAMTMDDIRKYSEAERVAKFDDAALFKLPEEDRLVYALGVAGLSPKITDNSPLRHAPLIRAVMDHDPDAMRNCKGDHAKDGPQLTPENIAAMEGNENSELARSAALKTWIDDLRGRIGENKFDDRMRDAAAHLEANDFTGHWPAATDFYGEEPPPPTFKEVQNKLQ